MVTCDRSSFDLLWGFKVTKINVHVTCHSHSMLNEDHNDDLQNRDRSFNEVLNAEDDIMRDKQG